MRNRCEFSLDPFWLQVLPRKEGIEREERTEQGFASIIVCS